VLLLGMLDAMGFLAAGCMQDSALARWLGPARSPQLMAAGAVWRSVESRKVQQRE